jgi:uncharacterized protein (DUF433 family)
MAVDIGTLITSSPDIRGGRPRIAGTGVTVQRIAGWYQLGLNPEVISARIGHVTLAQVHAALAYYHANRDEIDRAIEQDDADAEEVGRQLAAQHQVLRFYLDENAMQLAA